MGREIRKVPPNWEHPKGDGGEYLPLYEGYQQELAGFKDKIDEDGLEEAIEYYGGGPMRDNYVSYSEAEATWVQVYETVSEGTPVTPPFETKEKLVDYLVEHGTFWDHGTGYSRELAEKFVAAGYVPSMVVANGKILSGINSVEAFGKD